MSPRRSKREVERALENLSGDLAPGQTIAPSDGLTDDQKQAIREVLRYRYHHHDDLETTKTSVGLTPSGVREILEHMDDDQEHRIVETLCEV